MNTEKKQYVAPKAEDVTVLVQEPLSAGVVPPNPSGLLGGFWSLWI